MTSRFQRAGRTLSLLGPLRWLRLSGDRHPLHGHQQVSFLGWRFEEPDAEKLRVVEEARGARWEHFSVSCTHFLAAVLSGELRSDALSSSFPLSVHEFRRLGPA
ncbi:hypothetical protein [Streptomyces sp. S1]|uniref:hypothetical protein n=1 Tax=Streptomyces sp. S1 TaxID=718288 RepID=UPI003D70550B